MALAFQPCRWAIASLAGLCCIPQATPQLTRGEAENFLVLQGEDV